MIHLVSIIQKNNNKVIFFKDFWGKFEDIQPFIILFRNYSPFVQREPDKTYKIMRTPDLKMIFANFSDIILILGGSLDISVKELEKYLIYSYNLFHSLLGDISNHDVNFDELQEFENELDRIIRASATNAELEKLDHTVEEKTKITAASEERYRRDGLIAQYAAELMEQYPAEFLDNTITRVRLYLSASMKVHYQVIVDFSTFPYPPMIEFPKELIDILGTPENCLETIKNWDPVSPPPWIELIYELENKVYHSEYHIVEPIIEEDEPSKMVSKTTYKLSDEKIKKGIVPMEKKKGAPKIIMDETESETTEEEKPAKKGKVNGKK
ncbi:MAG: hypothetical protein ACTSWR_11465 [Candidatus Helarchaeota archaeon]